MAESGRVRILGVLVLYRRALEDSVTWKALTRQIASLPKHSFDFQLLICDNGPLPQTPPVLPEWAEYVGICDNRGLAWAYNYGLAQAQSGHADWLLTLDQDTVLPSDFLFHMTTLLTENAGPAAAFVPQLVSHTGRVHSPVLAGIGGERRIERGFQGVMAGDVRPFNSAALVRVTALEVIGGYDRRFWLNYLDHAVFHSLQKAGFAVWIAGDVQVQHHLSLHEGRDRMSEEHFRHFSAAESSFRDLYASRLEGLVFTLRLFLRALNQKRRGDAAHFLHATLAVLKQRIFLSRRERIRRWELEVSPMAAEPVIAMRVRGVAT